MEQLNVVGLVGTAMMATERYRNIYGRRNVYGLCMDIVRDSGTPDCILVLFQEEKIEAASFGALPWNEPGSLAALIKEGSRIEVTGAIQTCRNTDTGRMQVFVWANHLAAVQEDTQGKELNTVYITGEVSKPPVSRETPKGRRITDIILRIPSVFTQGYDIGIPCICWEKLSEKAGKLSGGMTVYLEGRLQSREYVKRYQDGSEEIVTTWEVSVSRLDTEQEEGQDNGN